MLEALLILGWVATVAGFLLYMRDQSQATGRERNNLLSRIQAPEVAAYQDDAAPSDVPLYVPTEDDAAWDEYAEQREKGEAR